MQAQDAELDQHLLVLHPRVIAHHLCQRSTADLAEAPNCEELEARGHLQVLVVGGQLLRLNLCPQILPLSQGQAGISVGIPGAPSHDGPLADGRPQRHHDEDERHPYNNHVEELLPLACIVGRGEHVPDDLETGHGEGCNAEQWARQRDPPDKARHDQRSGVKIHLLGREGDVRLLGVEVVLVLVPAQEAVFVVLKEEDVEDRAQEDSTEEDEGHVVPLEERGPHAEPCPEPVLCRLGARL
mmetsp:Transcript_60912/g.173125  ORF Transcript_60912/g.173125 Transcript_60912/m.173125 type:complete len:241 (+) Transcript_60912:1929-2651(+)